ncbi:MAG: methyltransferase domain-containing protein [Sphingomonadaceae bacterium]|jgi:2-polyprenyl-3-methyl-5-hydroxy-6-metoxy-1,4-benzoquinol methylase|nr:methyltransferase domain-containing protein [Sphingomonadaceae bacterium]NBU77549.1 methyltransferase domain-containing protein [Sphingomonadaceae bacterium]NCA00689.1 methyltransferase domain-containing protein [Sphingomonadaceae bacterium]
MLKTRALTEEQMDDPGLPAQVYAQVLGDLAHANSVTLARRPTMNFVRRLPRQSQPLRILDVGFGDGDMLRHLSRWAARHGIAVTLTGIDLNARSAGIAAAKTPDTMGIHYLTGDYQDLAGQGWDVILSSLVAHHMQHDELIAFLQFMAAEARVGWFINDLHRHGFAWLGYPLLARIMRWHPIVRQDGQLSIARSFRPAEWRSILDEVGLSGARVRRVFPFRLCVEQIR